MTKPALKVDDEFARYGVPPGNEHLTFDEFVAEGEWSADNEPLVAHEEIVALFERKFGRPFKA